MSSLLATLRHRTPQLTPEQFLAHHPGAWVQFYDDTPRKDPAKALSMASFDPDVARRKQQDRCAACFSLQAFGASRTREGIASFRNLGVDIDLVRASERRTLSLAEIEARKEEYLRRVLLPFPLKAHWIVETRHGFHVLFRLRPLQDAEGIQSALAVNRRLVAVLRGDPNAVLLTQVLRLPGTYQFKQPEPFHCRLILDNSRAFLPYSLSVVRNLLDAWAVLHGTGTDTPPQQGCPRAGVRQDWQAGLPGVPEGQRNATAASVVGGILCRLPEKLWETAGWGGLKEWNRRNPVPLPERELRGVFQSIARREHARRLRAQWRNAPGTRDVSPGNAVNRNPQPEYPLTRNGTGRDPGVGGKSFPPAGHADH